MTFIAPNTKACEDVGIGYAYMPGSDSWIRAAFADLPVFKHKIGHNFGLDHANRIISPSNEQASDDTTPMGGCVRCNFNSVEQLRLGWSRALSLVNWASFTGSTVVNLPALSDAGTFRDLGVVQIRLAIPGDPGVPKEPTRYVYVSYRVTKNQDSGLPERHSMATIVHGFHGESWLLAWLKNGQAYVNTANMMVVRQEFSDVNQAKVTVCKWITAQSECGTFSTFERIPGATGAEEATHKWHDCKLHQHARTNTTAIDLRTNGR